MVITNAMFLPYIALIGIGLLIAEFILPTKGTLGILGAICFVVATISLTHTPEPAMRLSPLMCVVLNVIVLGTVAIVLYVTHRGYTRHKTDDFTLVGQTAHVVDWDAAHQRVEIGGALWSAATQGGHPLKRGQAVRVTAQDNLILTVEPVGDFS